MKERRLPIFGLLFVAVLGVFVWMTRHPDHPALDRASAWPLVGPWVERFRVAWLPPPSAEVLPETAPETEVIRVWLPVVDTPDTVAPPLERPRQGPIEGKTETGEPSRVAEPVRPLAALAADPARRQRALELLGAAAVEDAIGPYLYLGDAPAPERWSRLASALDGAFRERTGQTPIGEPAETVIALVDAGVYRALKAQEPRLAGLEATGHAGAGLAVLLRSESAESDESTLVHELVHLVSRRALGPALPPWLDEGLAEDLAQTPFDEVSRFRLGGLRSEIVRSGRRIELRGAVAGLDLLASALARGEARPLRELVELDWERFVGGGAATRYAHALFLVRFLHDGGDPRLTAGFRGFLAGIAAGGSADRAALERSLGESLDALEPRFRAFVAGQRATRVDAAIAALAVPGERLVRP